MEKTLFLQSDFAHLELKHYDDNDTFSLNLVERDGTTYLTSYSREEFEQLEKTIRFLLN
ncbi:hypothetical protein HMI01_11270 [Halolactibacillus miurensis]|uniref:Uncharacterized protein n=1 Tax=Halolactibacillus miurensis TaxID=306541 RepID=A0A1I6SG83_9BACI|nr:hypothetical protein [Halolactibacillus miurensis]GEM04139.1 hypothetical protein HMI01_11270 [Halolactibacillus miurensis]SFS75830.1 hypothetical protein SAMN05421668_10916 [Halolactibacillus miurensis]